MSEKERLAFVLKRDGEEEMLKFAEQSLAAYVAASCAKGPYSDTIDDLIEALVGGGKKVKMVQVYEDD